jgi:hypothetical protein
VKEKLNAPLELISNAASSAPPVISQFADSLAVNVAIVVSPSSTE